MINDTIKLRTSIHPSLLRFTLLKGSLKAIFGALILVCGGMINSDDLQRWGWLILIIGVGLITFGLLPYRKLKRLESKPNELVVDIKHLHYIVKGKNLCTVPLSCIQQLDHFHHSCNYGIKMTLKKAMPEKIRFYNTQLNMCLWQKKSLKSHHCDLFFPYFSARTYATIEDLLKPNLRP